MNNYDFNPALRFCVCSDIHIDEANDIKAQRLEKLIKKSFDIAEKSKSYESIDSFFFAGDSTNGGKPEQYDAFVDTVKTAIAGRSKWYAVIAKNHDNWELGRDCIKTGLKHYRALTGKDTDFHVVLGGYHFIGISTSDNDGEYYSEEQKKWLDEQLEAASKQSKNKPVFVFQHEHVKNTVYGSSDFDGWGVSYLSEIFEKYPQIVHFSGHSHYPLNDPRSVWQGEFTAVGTGALSYAEFTVDDERCVHPENCEKIAQGWIVECDGSGSVFLRGFDFLSDEELCSFSITNDPFEGKLKLLRKRYDAAPSFPNEASISVEKLSDGIRVTFPAAEDGAESSPVFLYRIKLLSKSGELIKETKKNLSSFCSRSGGMV